MGQTIFYKCSFLQITWQGLNQSAVYIKGLTEWYFARNPKCGRKRNESTSSITTACKEELTNQIKLTSRIAPMNVTSSPEKSENNSFLFSVFFLGFWGWGVLIKVSMYKITYMLLDLTYNLGTGFPSQIECNVLYSNS